MTNKSQTYQALISAACNPLDVATLALIGVISEQTSRKPPYDVPLAGLGIEELLSLKNRYFPSAPTDFALNGVVTNFADRLDEFYDLLTMLLEHRSEDTDESRWLAHAIATASMAENHLWQDMGLPSRVVLSELLTRHFASLATRNIGDMKWKKFFYRQLCERAGLTICRAPSCNVCSDYQHCFGSEDQTSS